MTKAEKEAFKKRMPAGRAKAARAKKNGKKKNAKKAKAKKRNVTTRAASNRGKSQKRSVTSRGRTNAGASHRKAKKKNSRRRNQEPGSSEAAARMFEQFHQKAPGRVSEVNLATRYPEHFAELGKLIELRIYLDEMNPDFQINGFGNCKLVSTPDGSNLYFIGGDQALDLVALDIASDKDFVELGTCHYISYHTVKGFHDFEPTTYYHEFGEEDGIEPVLSYDRLNQRLFLMSGNYRVRPEGIVN